MSQMFLIKVICVGSISDYNITVHNTQNNDVFGGLFLCEDFLQDEVVTKEDEKEDVGSIVIPGKGKIYDTRKLNDI